MKIIKRNQIIISVLALMLITVGYMSYTSNFKNTLETANLMDSEEIAGIGDAKLVNSNNTVDESSVSEEADDDEQAPEEKESSISTAEASSETSTTLYDADYFVASRLERDKMYSQMIDTYQSLLENTTVSEEQRNISTQEITTINNKKNSIMIAENLIKNLGYEDVVIFVNDNSTSVIIKAEKLEEADIAKIQNIVCREIGVETENVHISLK